MPLKPQAALDKDKLGARHPATLQHRHFAVIAGILAEPKARGADPKQHATVCEHFANELAKTNPNFDPKRFLIACEALPL